jgi:tetratricopeptide (TPR) repeat protein
MVDVFAVVKRVLVGIYETLILPFGFLRMNWQDSGRIRGLLIGFPAVIVVASVCILLAHSALSNNTGLVSHYQSLIDEIEKKDGEYYQKMVEFNKATNDADRIRILDETIAVLERKDFYCRRMVALDDSSDEDKFELAKSSNEIALVVLKKLQLKGTEYFKSDDSMNDRIKFNDARNRTISLINVLAPLDDKGFGPAHLFRAEDYFKQYPNAKSAQMRSQLLARCKQQLEFALDDEKQQVDVKAMLAQVNMELKRYDEAITLFNEVLASRPLVYQHLRKCYQGTIPPRVNDERQMLMRAIKALQIQVLDNPNNIPAWLGLTECYVLTKQFEVGEEVLLAALRDSKSQFLKNHMANNLIALYQYWIDDSKKSDGSPDYQQQKLLIEKAMKISKEDERILAKVTLIATSDSEYAAWAKGVYDAYADTSRSHFVLEALVADALRDNDDSRAIKYLNEQIERTPDAAKVTIQFAMAQNNLAYKLLTSDSPDAKRAMELVNEALKVQQLTQFQKSAFFHTKARVHMILGEYEEAIAYFNTIKQFREDDEEFYELLIECHQKVQNPEQPTIELLQAELAKVRARNALKTSGTTNN